MANKSIESSQGDGGAPAQGGAPVQGGAPAHPPPVGQQHGPPEHMSSRGANTIFKSGPLFISSKGIGWTSWKKRWFILTRTSLVFFRSDPSAVPQKGSEVNLTLGGIDLNNSGSVVAKPDKKLLTVLFPDGRDGRAFTLKAETLEDLNEWKTALESALSQAPPAASVVGQNGILKSDQDELVDAASEKSKDKQPVKSIVLGRPILLALEDVDGTPSFLEKALRFIEEHGVKAEGILRQAADVDEVERRIREFEQGKTDFSPDEDAHVIADCLKYVLRELPSSPVPASCCNALLEARQSDRAGRVNAMRTAVCETFPEPNRRLLQRILMMMQTVASHKADNRMSTSAVSACMAPLLLRPLLAGECEIDTDFDVGADSSVQLLQAAAAANHAQAIVIILLEEYENIFGEGSVSPDLYSDSEESGSGSEEASDEEGSYEDDGVEESDVYTDDDLENASSGSCVESCDSRDDDQDDNKVSSSDIKVPETGDELRVSTKVSSSSDQSSLLPNDDAHRSENVLNHSKNDPATKANAFAEPLGDVSAVKCSDQKRSSSGPTPSMQKASTISNGPLNIARRPTIWGRTAAKKNLSMESLDCPLEEEAEVESLEATKTDLENQIADEVRGTDFLQANLERRKKALHERREALEKDVARLQEQLQKERDKRTALETGLNTFQGSLNIPATVDEKTKVELEEIVQAEADVMNLTKKVDDLGSQLNQQLEKNYKSGGDSRNQLQQMSAKTKDKQRDKEATATATSHDFERSRSKDNLLDGATEIENENKRESTSSGHKDPSLESTRNSNSRLTATGSSKKSGSRVEGSNSTTSALTKLTTRLNFLKERRSQMSNELQNVDKSRGGPVQAERSRGSETQQSLQNLEKSRGSEIQSVSVAERGGESESRQSLQNINKESQSVQSLEKSRKSNSNLLQNVDGDKKPESQHPHSLDRGRSEGHTSYGAERSMGSEGQPRTTSRTLSR